MDYLETVDGDHGRIETRRYWISDDIEWFQDKRLWEGLRCVGMVVFVREIGDERSYERRCLRLILSGFFTVTSQFMLRTTYIDLRPFPASVQILSCVSYSKIQVYRYETTNYQRIYIF